MVGGKEIKNGKHGRAQLGHTEGERGRKRQREIEMKDEGFCNLTHD